MSKDEAYRLHYFLFRKEAKPEKLGHVVLSNTRYTNWKNVTNRRFPNYCCCCVIGGCHKKAR